MCQVIKKIQQQLKQERSVPNGPNGTKKNRPQWGGWVSLAITKSKQEITFHLAHLPYIKRRLNK